MTGGGGTPRPAADPAAAVVALVTRADPGLDADVVRDVVARVAPGRAKARRLAAGLAARPGVLTDGLPPAPQAIGVLLSALRAAGAEQISPPHCARCGRPISGTLPHVGEDWRCHGCARGHDRCAGCGRDRTVSSRDQDDRPYCTVCARTRIPDPQPGLLDLITRLEPALRRDVISGAVARAAGRAGERRRMAWAVAAAPALLTGQGHAAPEPSVLRLIDELVAAGARTVARPACPDCGRVVPLDRGHAGRRTCRRCADAARARACARCGRTRQIATRDGQGQPMCSRCFLDDPANREECCRCGRLRAVETRTPDGPICPSCLQAPVATCAICGRVGPAAVSKITGRPRCKACHERWMRCSRCGAVKHVYSGTIDAPVCGDCTTADIGVGQAWPPCPRCGTVEKPTGGTCRRCRIDDTFRQLTADASGDIPPHLEPLRDALRRAERPSTVIEWLRHDKVKQTLADVAQDPHALSHDKLDQFDGDKTAEHLRSVLVAVGSLPERDEQLARLERWIEQAVTAVADTGQRRLLRHYATWHLLRRLRARNHASPTTYGQAQGIRERVRAAVLFLEWLATRGRTIADCGQDDLDAWLTDTHAHYLRQSGTFIRWAVDTGHTRQRLETPAHTWTGPSDLIDGEHRWAQARRLLHDDTLDLADRVAGLLLLLYAQRAATITALTTTHVDIRDDTVSIHLGPTPVELPEPVAGLLRALEAARAGHAAIGRPAATRWLFPGRRPGNPVSAAQMNKRLRDIGLRPKPARSAAMFGLAAELPAALLARMLGISIGVAVDWQHLSNGDWTGYAAEVSRRPHTQA